MPLSFNFRCLSFAFCFSALFAYFASLDAHASPAFQHACSTVPVNTLNAVVQNKSAYTYARGGGGDCSHDVFHWATWIALLVIYFL